MGRESQRDSWDRPFPQAKKKDLIARYYLFKWKATFIGIVPVIIPPLWRSGRPTRSYAGSVVRNVGSRFVCWGRYGIIWCGGGQRYNFYLD